MAEVDRQLREKERALRNIEQSKEDERKRRAIEVTQSNQKAATENKLKQQKRED